MLGQLTLYKEGYGIAPLFFKNHSFSLAGLNRKYALTPAINRPDAEFIANGVTHVALNQGRSDITNVPFSNRAGFVESGIFKAYVNSQIPFEQMSNEQIDGACDAFTNSRDGGYGVWTSGMQEAYGGNLPWVIENHSAKGQRARKRLAATTQARGGNYYDGYDGHLNIIGATDDFSSLDGLRSKLSNATEALNFCKQNSGFGNQFFTGNEYEWRDALLNFYWAGYINPALRTNMFFTMQRLHLKAMQAVGVSRRLLHFMFGRRTEFAGPNIAYNIPVEGGVWKANAFPSLAFNVEFMLTLIGLLEGDIYIWSETERFGENPGIIKNNVTDNGQLIEYYQGTGNPQRKDPTFAYNGGGAPYFNRPLGGMDSSALASKVYSIGAKYAGQQWVFTRNKLSQAANFNTVSDAYILDRQQQKEPLTILFQTNSKRFLIYYDGHSTGKWTDRDIDILTGTPFSATFCSGIPYCILLNGNTPITGGTITS